MKLLTLCVATLLFASGALANAANIDLPRRGALGLGLQPTPDGVIIAQVPESASAWSAGVRPGDRLTAIAGVPVGGYLDLQAASHQLSWKQPVEITVSRDGETLSFEIAPTIMPRGQVEGGQSEYGFVITPSGNRIRTVTLVPDASSLRSEAGLPGVVYLQGIACQSIDLFGGPDHPRGRLFHDLIAAGFAVSFADKPGIGDSDGQPCREGGFDTEVEAYTSAAQAFAHRPDIDASRIFVIGVSLGGVQAPLLAREVDLAGIVTWGTGVQPWFDYIITNFRMREWREPTADPQLSHDHFATVREVLARALVLGQSVEEIRQARPEQMAAFEAAYGPLDGFAGRSLAFHREIDAAPVRPAWEAFDGALLALHGEQDVIATRTDHQWAAEIVNRNHPGSARFEVLDDLTHGWRRREDGGLDYQFHERATAWLTEQATGISASD